MGFPQKTPITGTERIALYEEPSGNSYVTASQVASLAGSTSNGIFGPLNYWQGDRVPDTSGPSDGLLNPALPAAGAFNPSQNYVVWADFKGKDWEFLQSSPSADLIWNPTPSAIRYNGWKAHTFTDIQEAFTVQLDSGDILDIQNNSIVLSTASTAVGGALILGGDKVELISNTLEFFLKDPTAWGDLNSWWGTSQGDTEPRSGFALTGSASIPTIVPDGHVFKIGSPLDYSNILRHPDVDNTKTQMLMHDASTGIVYKREVSSLPRPLAVTDQVIPASTTRRILGTGGLSSLSLVDLNTFSVETSGQISFTSSSNNFKFESLPGASTLTDYVVYNPATGQLAYRSLPSGTDTNFANATLTLSAPRAHKGGDHSFSLDELSNFSIGVRNSATPTQTASLTVSPTAVRLTHKGDTPDNANIFIGTGTSGNVNTVLPSDSGNNYNFLKYDEASGRLYQEDVTLGADGNGIFDVNNDGDTAGIDSFVLKSSSGLSMNHPDTAKLDIATTGTAATISASLNLITDRETLSLQNFENGGVVFSLLNTTNEELRIGAGSLPASSGGIIRANEDLLTFTTTGGEYKFSNRVDVTSASRIAVFAGSPADRLKSITPQNLVNQIAPLLPDPTIPPVEWRQILSASTQTVTSAAYIAQLSGGTATGQGTKYTSGGEGIDVPAGFSEVHVSLTVNDGTVTTSGSIALYDLQSNQVLISKTFVAKNSNTVYNVAFTYMNSFSSAARLVIRLLGLENVTISNISLSVRD